MSFLRNKEKINFISRISELHFCKAFIRKKYVLLFEKVSGFRIHNLAVAKYCNTLIIFDRGIIRQKSVDRLHDFQIRVSEGL